MTTPSGVIRPIRLPFQFREPQVAIGAGRDAVGCAPAVMPALNSVTTPSGVIRPIRLPLLFREPQVAIGAGRDAAPGCAPAVMPALNSVTTCAHAPPDSNAK